MEKEKGMNGGRTLKYVILGLLMEKSMTGYDIVKTFSERLNEFWYAKHSQIYPELKRLEEEGLVEYNIQISGEVMEKKCYSLTNAGDEEFHRWLQAETALEPAPKDVFRLKVYFLPFLDREKRQEIFRHQIGLHQERLRHLEEELGKYAGVPQGDDPALGDYMVLEHGVMREKMTIQWLKLCIRQLGPAGSQKDAGTGSSEGEKFPDPGK